MSSLVVNVAAGCIYRCWLLMPLLIVIIIVIVLAVVIVTVIVIVIADCYC